MSTKRQTSLSANQLIEVSANKLVSRKINMCADEHDPAHSHPWHQLIYPHRGVLKTLVQDRLLYVPSNRAVLIPAHCSHESWAISPLEFIGVYVSPELLALPEARCRTFEATPFLRELILQVVPIGATPARHDSRKHRLCEVLCDQLLDQEEASLDIIVPRDRRVKPIAEELMNSPHSAKKLARWTREVGASERTISRIFENQTGLTFRQWRRRLRLINSLHLLEQGIKIQSVASAVGYDSPSAFVYSFRKEFGITPGRYFS